MEQSYTIQEMRDLSISGRSAAATRPTFWQSIPPWLVGPVICAGTIVIYALAAAVGLRFVLKPENITSVWPASGVALALMAMTTRRHWFWVLLGAALAQIPGNIGVATPIPAICFYAVANVTETLVAASILTRFGRERVDFSRVGQHLRLFLAVGPANALTAALAAGPVVYFGYAPHFWEFWRLWFVADGLGMLLLTPVILSARAPRQYRLSHRRVVEAAYLLVAGGVFASFIFMVKRPTSPTMFDLPFVITIPLILWAALRTNVSVTSWISLIFSMIAVIGTLEGLGPFAGRGGSVQSAIVSLQIVIMAWTTCGLVVSVSTVQHREGLHKLLERETHFRLLAANSPAAVFLTNAAGECVYINDRWQDITGQVPNDAMGHGWARVVHADDQPRVEAEWRKTVAASGDFIAEYRVCRPSGEVRWITARLAALHSRSGALQGHVGIAIDLTDRYRMERVLEDRLHFEILIADISNTLVNVPADEVNPAVDRALRSLCDLLDVDRVSLSERSLGAGGAHVLRSHTRVGSARDTTARTDLQHPWLWQRVDAGESVAAVRLDELPPEAAVDRASLSSRGVRSFILVPVSVGGIVRFAFSVATVQHERDWLPDLARQLRVLGETIANSIVRANADMDLRQSEAMLRRLNAELLRAEENERRRLASALHDELAQSLFAAIAQLVAVRGKPGTNFSAEALQPVITMLDDALRQTRDLTFELCPPILYEVGLSAALEKLIEKFQRRFGLTCRLHAGNSRENRLDSELASLIYQAVRELLMNVVKHSGASIADIRLVQTADEVSITVSDDGKGMTEPPGDNKHLPSGFGLFNIRERVRSMGGRVEITVGADVGCSVCLILPGNPSLAHARE